MSSVRRLVTESLLGYLEGLPFPKTEGRCFSLSVGDCARLLPFGLAVGGLSYLSLKGLAHTPLGPFLRENLAKLPGIVMTVEEEEEIEPWVGPLGEEDWHRYHQQPTISARQIANPVKDYDEIDGVFFYSPIEEKDKPKLPLLVEEVRILDGKAVTCHKEYVWESNKCISTCPCKKKKYLVRTFFFILKPLQA